MRERHMTLIVALVAALSGPSVVLAQTSQQRSADAKPAASAPSHDLNGMWEFFQRRPEPRHLRNAQQGSSPMTPWAQAKWDAAKPGYGPKAQPGGNDPILNCTPSGIPRILFFPLPFELVMTPERVYMFFEREHAWRQIWTDGRDHPKR